MTEYKCIKRVTTDGFETIREVGDVLTVPTDLTDADAQSLLRQRAIVEYHPPDQAPAAQTQTAQPSLNALKKEDAQLQQEIANMEHEGGAPS